MRILGNTRLFQVALVAAGIVALGASDALARSRGGGGSYGSYGSAGGYGSGGSYAGYGSAGGYGSSGGYASSGSYGSAGSYASSASHGGRPGLFARWHAKKAARKASNGSHGGYGSAGSYGSSGSYGSYGSVVSYGSSGSHGGSGSYGGGVYYSDPVESAAPMETPQPELDPNVPPDAPTTFNSEATIFVNVPAEAKVFVNDLPTTSTGVERHYVSRGLRSGLTYSYKLRVEFERDGKAVVEDKLVRLQSGQRVELAFGGAAAGDQQSAKTVLKLHVPIDAKVTLAGAETQQTGESRTYVTTSLSDGQQWEGYVVRVELQRDGETLVEERSLSVEGGERYELTFEFAEQSTQLAAVN